MDHTAPEHDHGLGWLRDDAEPVALQTRPTTLRSRPSAEPTGWEWLESPPSVDSESVPPTRPSRFGDGNAKARMRLGGFLAIAVAAAVAATTALTREHDSPAAIAPPPSATTPATTSVPTGACAGLAGTTVTDGVGDLQSMTGVIVAFESAYYRTRAPDTALGLVAPEAGLVPEALAAGIASIPAGTTHCVAITPIAETAADVHLAETHPDGHRIDYLQLINVRHDGPDRLLITNIQKRGG